MIKFRITFITCYITMGTLLLFACSNDNQDTISEKEVSQEIEAMTDSNQNNSFIIDTDSLNRSWKADEENDSKHKTAMINPTFITLDSSAVGQEFIFNLYEDDTLSGSVNRVSTDLNNIKSISGLLYEDKGSFVFTVNDGQLFGQIRLTDRDKIIQVRFSDELNEYQLTESQRKDMDVLPGSAPMRRGNN